MPETLVKPCVACGRTDRVPAIELEPDWLVERCEGCGLRTLSPEPAEVVLEEFEEGSGYEDAFALRDAIVARNHRSLADLERVVVPGRLLDVGCGLGFLLESARARGWEAAGVDPSSFSVEKARAKGFEAHHGMLEDVDLDPASFDAIALLQVVEHVTDPRPLLAACRALLKPGGALLIETPNPAGALARVKRERFNYWIPPVHCVWYTPRALTRLLRGGGFEPVVRTTWSARVPALHDGIDVVANTRMGRRLPARARRVVGEAVARAMDALRMGSFVEQIAIPRDEHAWSGPGRSMQPADRSERPGDRSTREAS